MLQVNKHKSSAVNDWRHTQEGQVWGNEEFCASPAGWGTSVNPMQAHASIQKEILDSAMRACVSLLPVGTLPATLQEFARTRTPS